MADGHKSNWSSAVEAWAPWSLTDLAEIIRAVKEYERNHGSFPTATQLRAILEHGR